MLEFFIFISFSLFFLILLQQRKKKIDIKFFFSIFLTNITYILFYLLFSNISFNNFIIVLFSLILSQSISLLLLQGVRSSIQIKLLKRSMKKELSEKDIDNMDKEIFLDRVNNFKKQYYSKCK